MAHRMLFVLSCLLVAAATMAVAVAAAADRASLPPEQILEQVGTDLAKVRSVHLDAEIVDADGSVAFAGDVTSSGSLDLVLTQGRQKVRVRKVGLGVFYFASASYWRKEVETTADRARRLANRWVKVPSSDAEARELVQGIQPQDLAYCLTRRRGTMTNGGVATVAGEPTILVVDAGDKPGAGPGTTYIAASGPALPLRIVQTGPTHPGGPKIKRCGDDGGEPDTTKSGDIRLSYGNRPAIVAPKHAIDLTDVVKPSHSYPASEKRAFITSCKRTAAGSFNGKLTKSQVARYCATALSCLQKRLSYQRFSKMAERMYSGERNPDAKVLSACVKVATDEVSGPNSL